jgi:hypothetical protein
VILLSRKRILTSIITIAKAVVPPSFLSPIPYALIVGPKSPTNPELYNGTVRAYSDILVAPRPRVRITV